MSVFTTVLLKLKVWLSSYFCYVSWFFYIDTQQGSDRRHTTPKVDARTTLLQSKSYEHVWSLEET